MTRDEAIKKAQDCFQFNVPSQEWYFTPLRLVAALENLGVLKFDEKKPGETLWTILRTRGVPLDTAQWVCNDAMNAGLLRSPQVTTTPGAD